MLNQLQLLTVESLQNMINIEEKLGIPMCFAHPYSSGERDSNEVLNRYARWLIPKKAK